LAIVELLAVIAAAVATIIYAGLTWRMVNEMRQTRLNQERPYLFVELSRQQSSIMMRIVNGGNGSASHVKVVFDTPSVITFENAAESQLIDITQLPMIRGGIPFMSPHRIIETSIGIFSEYFEKVKSEQRPTTYTGTISYKDSTSGLEYNEPFVLDFTHFEGMSWPVRHDMHDLVKQFEEIKKLLNKRG